MVIAAAVESSTTESGVIAKPTACALDERVKSYEVRAFCGVWF